MKLNGVVIYNLEGLKENFNLQEIFKNIEIGTFREFQLELEKDGIAAAKEILQALDFYEGKQPFLAAFFYENRLNLTELERVLEPVAIHSFGMDKKNFFSCNAQMIQRLAAFLGDAGTKAQAVELYLFLLIYVQAHPREEIPMEAETWIKDRLNFLKATGNAHIPEKDSYLSAEHIKTDGWMASLPKICIQGCKVLLLEQGRIWVLDDRGRREFSLEEEIAGYAYSDSLGLIAFNKEGRLCPSTRGDIRSRVPLDERIDMAAAFGDHYLLLTDAGHVISDVDLGKEWEELCWVGAGLNSITGIRRKGRGVMQMGSDSRLTDFSDVKAIYTRSIGRSYRYALLRMNNTLITDDGEVIEHVSAANLWENGYIYAVCRKIYMREFHSQAVYELDNSHIPDDYRITEVYAGNSIAVCGGFLSDGEYSVCRWNI